MKNVAFLVDGISSGGVARVAISLARIFNDRNIKCTIFSISDEATNKTIFNDVKYIDVDFNKNAKGYFFRLLDVFLKIRKKKFTHVFVLTMGRLSVSFSFFSLFLLPTMRVFVCEHGGFENYSNLIRLLKIITYPLYSKVIVLTDYDRNVLLRYKVDVECVYNPSLYPISDFHKIKNKKRYLSVGHLISGKGYFRLLDIWCEYRLLGGEGNLTIVGSGPDEYNLREYILSKDICGVDIVPPTRDIELFYLSHDVLLSTSYAEGLPMTFIEAHRFGLPIISYNVKTGPSEIISDGQNGYLITDGDSVVFLGKMFNLEDNSIYEEMSRNSLSTSYRFSSDVIFKKWDSLIYG